MSLDADIKDFVHDHHPHGHLTADATEPVWNGYLLTVACPCGVVFRRWVTPEDAELDLNRFSGASSGWRGIRHDREGRNNARSETMSPNRKSRIKLFRNPLTALALLYAVVLLGCAPEGTTRILSYHGLPAGGGGSSVRHPGVDFAALVGDPVIAAADGVVVQAGFGWGCGNGVSIEHRAQEPPWGGRSIAILRRSTSGRGRRSNEAMSSARLAQPARLGASPTFILDFAPTSPAHGMAALPTTSIPSPSSSGVSTPRDPFATPHSRPARGLATRADLPGAVQRPGPCSVPRCVERRLVAGDGVVELG